MSLCRKKSSERVLLRGLIVMLVVVLASVAALAQDSSVPKVEIFAGYQWMDPGITVPTPFRPPTNPLGFNLPAMSYGWGTSLTYNFSDHWGGEVDYGGSYNKFANDNTVTVGPRFTWRTENVNFFLHGLVGWNSLGLNNVSTSNAFGAILGGGMDLKVIRHLSIRVFEADWVWADQNFSDAVSPAFPDLRRPNMSGARLRGGLVFNFGFPPGTLPTAACSVQPSEVMVGEPVTVTATGSNFNPKHTLGYSWTSTGGKVTGTGTTATIATDGLAGGSYTATAHITDAKMKKGGDASCSATFTVKEPPRNAPTMSCSANPASVMTGASSNITCTCSSPDGVPVTVGGWNASGGSISGSGSTATLTTTGAPAGAITVSATCTDSRGLTAAASTQVNVEVPPPAPPQSTKLSECEFPNKMKPWRVDNTCKAILDDVAQNLQQNPDNKLVIVGNAEPTEKRKNLAAERAVNSKAYLTGGEAKQGIDPSRIETRTGSAGTKTAEYWVVPSGATFSEAGTQPVDENAVKAVPDHPRAPAKKKAAPAAQ